MGGELFVLGTSHAVAPTGVRERMHVDLEEVYAGLARVAAHRALLAEALPLATCGRLEVYGVSERPERAIRVLRDLVAARTGLGRAELATHSYVRLGEEAARHLFRVAAGLDSVVYGEAQILGQVRDALHHPSAERVAGTLLKRLFQSALAAGKRVRTETEIGRGSASVAGAALALLEREIGAFASVTALVLGAGETGGLVARLLLKAGVARLMIANRTLGRAEALAAPLGAEAYPLSAVPSLLGEADIVIGTVAGRQDLVSKDALEVVARQAPRSRWLLDLAHPRTFAPDVGALPGVRLLDLAQVFEQVESGRQARAAQVPRAEAIVDAEVLNFSQWVRSRQTASVLRAVREQVLALAQEEADRRSKGRSDEEREELQRFARSLARTLLYVPTRAIREADPGSVHGRWLLRSASSLFGVETRDVSGGAG